MFVILKVIVSAAVIGIVTEIARRFPTYGGIVAALPLVSILSIIWLYVQGEQNQTLSRFALGVLWGFPATAILLIIVFLSLRHSFPLFISLGFGVAGWFVFLTIQEVALKQLKLLLFQS
ncbi:DUF3147 family protein [Radiobacillus kanasensis]|uniref:DUF3147 family protein n=1 Tax=Radiobacillus kanasensis TaxID=2844358 RepID=UPI001E2F26AC|nr:DUF3147 family protein [Radiobacillus kanasensis]UFT98335.1 DUF3147 family protein [Radiobacillus kanasensis]